MKQRTWKHANAASISLAAGLALAALAVVAGGGCAPDAIRSNQATGFNGYLKQLAVACEPLIIGSENIGDDIRMNNNGADNYAYFLDVTSKLYYNRLTPAGYRQAVVGFLGAGAQSDRSIDCIVRTLPPDRPNAPAGTY